MDNTKDNDASPQVTRKCDYTTGNIASCLIAHNSVAKIVKERDKQRHISSPSTPLAPRTITKHEIGNRGEQESNVAPQVDNTQTSSDSMNQNETEIPLFKILVILSCAAVLIAILTVIVQIVKCMHNNKPKPSSVQNRSSCSQHNEFWTQEREN